MAEDENLSKHAAEASRKALEMASIDVSDIDLILLATSTPDDLFGSAGQVNCNNASMSKLFWLQICISLFVTPHESRKACGVADGSLSSV